MNVEHVWSTAILRGVVEDQQFLDQLLQHILQDPDATASDAADKTRDKIDIALANNDPLFIAARKHVSQHVDAYFKHAYGLERVPYKLEMFYLLHTQGRHVKYHNHKGSTLTGVLYINVPSGDLVLLDPRVNANRHVIKQVLDTGHFDSVDIKPKQGEIVVFPSYVYHLGMPNSSPLPRIVFVFDVMPEE